MSQVNSLSLDSVIGSANDMLTRWTPSSVGAAGSLGLGVSVAGAGSSASVAAVSDPTWGIPELKAPVFEKMNSREELERTSKAEVERLLAEVLNSLEFKQAMAFQSGVMTTEDAVETVQMGLQYNRDLQKRQGEIVKKARLEAIQKATKDAEAGILGKIFGWIGRIFSMIFLALSAIALVSTGQIGLAVLTIAGAVMAVMDFCSAISRECGGIDISVPGLIARLASADKADEVQKWASLGCQIFMVVASAAGAMNAAAKVSEMIGKVLNSILSLLSGATAVVSGAAGMVAAEARYRLMQAQAAEMQAQAFHEVLLAVVKQWADDFQRFRDDLDASLQQRSDWLGKEHALSKQLSAA